MRQINCLGHAEARRAVKAIQQQLAQIGVAATLARALAARAGAGEAGAAVD